MSSDIISLFQLDKPMSNRFIVVKENYCDGTFIINAVLNHWVKNKQSVLFVTVHNTVAHYHHAGLKMGHNVQKCVASGLITFYNLGEENVCNILSDEIKSLEYYGSKIKEKYIKMQEKNASDSIIIIDGVSHLFDLGYNIREVNAFCKGIVQVTRVYNSLALFLSSVSSEDDVTHVFSNLLSHMASTVVEVESLPSGLSADVSGRLTLKSPGKKFEPEHMFTLDIKSIQYLYKLFDRGVKLFAPGTI